MGDSLVNEHQGFVDITNEQIVLSQENLQPKDNSWVLFFLVFCTVESEKFFHRIVPFV
jgi:hypothetical protein